MDPAFAAKAVVGGHHEVVKMVVWDIDDLADRAFYLLQLTKELSFLLGDEKRAAALVRRFR